MIVNPVIYSGKKLPELDNPGDAADLLAGKQLVDQYGNLLTGSMPQKSASDLTASGRSVIVPAGYYPEQAAKEVAAATQATPAISVSSAGLITASAVQEEGYVAAGTKSATKQLTTQAAATITPGTSAKTAVAAGRYTTGAVTVAGSGNLVAGNIRSGVSIFGVSGNVRTALDKRSVSITNKTSVRLLLRAMESFNGIGSVALEIGQTLSLAVYPNSPMLVSVFYPNLGNNTKYFALDSGSVNCYQVYSFPHYDSAAPMSYVATTIFVCTDDATLNVKFQ